MYGDEGGHILKFVLYDGIYEAVYNKEGQLLTELYELRNMGTYNYTPSGFDYFGHAVYVVYPYWSYGNAPWDEYKFGSEIDNDRKIDEKVEAYRNEIYNKMWETTG